MKRSLLAVLVLLAAPPAATAATVSMDVSTVQDEGTHSYGAVYVVAAPGEVNTLELRYDGSLTVTDATAPLTGEGRCRNRDPHTVVCERGRLDSITSFTADLGDMDDSARAAAPDGHPYIRIGGGAGNDRLSGLGATFDGGDGDDHLVGDTGRETLNGEAGNDTLEGHGEGDNLYGGPGADTLIAGDGHDNVYAGGGTDHLDGGPGHDTLSDQDGWPGGRAGADTVLGGEGRDSLYSYAGRRRGVTVDLTRPDGNGEPGENDVLSGIEDLYGGGGDDTLIGDEGPNYIEGDRGQDEIRGGGGNDHLVSSVHNTVRRPNARAASYGPDRVSGDAGDDLVETLATLESEVTCGEGMDRVVLPGYSDDHAQSSLGPLVSATCERLAMGASRRRGGSVSLTPYPTAITSGAFTFAFQATGCCRRRLELRTLDRRPRRLGAATVGKPTRVAVPRAASHARRGVRGKVTSVGRNRFVWRFRAGF